MPREHGAWGILLIPFASAAGIHGVFDWKMALLLASILGFYLARASYLRRHTKWTVALLAGSAVCAAPLVFYWRLWWLVAFGVAAGPFAFRKTNPRTVFQLLAVAGLTLTAPAAWYVATGQLDRQAGILWLLNTLYFWGGILYVKMHIAAAIQRDGSRWRLGAGTLIYHLALALVAAWCWPVGLAFVPAIARGIAGVARLSPVLRIKRLAWTEVGYSVAYLILLVAMYRTRG